MDIENRVIKVVKKVSNINGITYLDTNLREIGFDSLKIVELIVELEDEFNIVFNDSDLKPSEFNIISDLVVAVNNQILN